VIRYLEQLERDLVEAVDRRNAGARSSRWRGRPRRRPDWSLVVTAAVVLVAIAVVFGISRVRQGEEHAVAPPPVRKEHPAPIPPHTPLRLVGNVTRVDPTTWRGQARGPGGVGTLTISGTVNLTARPCCDTPRSHAPNSTHTIAFTWTSAGGTLRGCVANTIYRRPQGRFVWDGIGRVTSATGTLRRYRGRSVSIAGETRTTAPDRARIILDAGAPPGGC
jgi:hypothetical protein